MQVNFQFHQTATVAIRSLTGKKECLSFKRQSICWVGYTTVTPINKVANICYWSLELEGKARENYPGKPSNSSSKL